MRLSPFKRPKIKEISNETINVFYACDDHYVKYMSVSVASLVKTASDRHTYAVHVLHTDISQENQEKLKTLQTENVSIDFIDVSHLLEKLKDNLALRDYYTSTTYFRFFIPDLFPNVNKAIYIDGDTTVLDDIALSGYLRNLCGRGIEHLKGCIFQCRYNADQLR